MGKLLSLLFITNHLNGWPKKLERNSSLNSNNLSSNKANLIFFIKEDIK